HRRHQAEPAEARPRLAEGGDRLDHFQLQLHRRFFHRAENLSYMPCERLAMRETEVDRQWYPVVIVTKPDDRRIRCPSTSRPIVPSNAPWRRCCTRVATVTRSSTSTRWPC